MPGNSSQVSSRALNNGKVSSYQRTGSIRTAHQSLGMPCLPIIKSGPGMPAITQHLTQTLPHPVTAPRAQRTARVRLCRCLVSMCREGNGSPLQYFCLENPMDGGAWKIAVHGVAEGRTRLSDFTFMHWRRKWQPTPVLLPGESQGRGSLFGCPLWGRTESDTTEVT